MHDVLPGFIAKEELSYGLLDLRLDGWVRESSWPGLFYLYTRDGEAIVELSPELGAIEAAFLQGYSVKDKDAASIKPALFMSALLYQAMNEGEDGSEDFQHARKLVADRFAGEFGKIIHKLWESKTLHEAEQEALAAANLMRRGASAIVRMKFPRRGRGSRSYPPKAVLAIRHAQDLCKHLRRLPTKREVRASLETIGVDYARSKDPDRRWAELFASAGLAALPE